MKAARLAHAGHVTGTQLAFLRGKGLVKGGSQPSAGVSLRPLKSALLLLSFQNTNSSLLNNYVLGAQLGSGHVSNLKESVNISFRHNQSLVPLGGAPISTSPLPPCGSPVEFWLD